MTRTILAVAVLVGLTAVVSAPLIVDGVALADPEEDCATEFACECVTRQPGDESTSAATVGGAFSHATHIVWCFQTPPFMGQFSVDDATTGSDFNGDPAYSPSYYFTGFNHYGRVEVTISGNLANSVNEADLVSLVEIGSGTTYNDDTATLTITRN